jgi:hypothetical protein
MPDFSLYARYLSEWHSIGNPSQKKQPKPAPNLDSLFLAQQIELYPKARHKLPSFAKKGCLFTKKSIEQATSEQVALFKAQQFSGETLIDLTGGLGVDDWAFSFSFNKVVSIDSDEDLNDLVRFNFELLGIKNIERITTKAQAYLTEIPEGASVYIDPDRRDEKGNRQLLLENCSPDLIQLIPELLKKECTVLIKLSPLFDATELIRKLKGISTIYAIAYKNEMKELLAVCNPADFPLAKPKFIAVNLTADSKQKFSTNSIQHHLTELSSPLAYFFEPNAALIKLQLWKTYSNELGLMGLNSEIAYLTGHLPITDFQGRQFKINQVFSGNLKKIAKYLKQTGIEQINIATRGYFENAETIRKTLKIKEGGNTYLFFLKSNEGNGLCLCCEH